MKLIDRYRHWNRLAYLSPRERSLNRALWFLLLVALAYAVLHHVYLVTKPPFVSWGPPVGAVFHELAIAYAGAFIFYLLIVRLPLRRDRHNIYRTVGPLIGLVVLHGNQLMETLNKTAGIDPPDRENTWENIKEMCSKINTNTQVEGLFFGTKGIGHNTVMTVIVDRMNRTRAGIEQILSFSSFLATDLIDLLSAFEPYTHFRTFSQHVAIVESTGLPIGNQDMLMWAHEIFNYTKLINDLDAYGREYLPTMTYEIRPGLMQAEDNPAVPPSG